MPLLRAPVVCGSHLPRPGWSCLPGRGIPLRAVMPALLLLICVPCLAQGGDAFRLPACVKLCLRIWALCKPKPRPEGAALQRLCPASMYRSSHSSNCGLVTSTGNPAVARTRTRRNVEQAIPIGGDLLCGHCRCDKQLVPARPVSDWCMAAA